MAQAKNYIKGTFGYNRTAPWGTVQNIDITDEGIESLKSLPKDAKGNRRIEICTQKNDPTKLSIYENTFTPKNSAGDNTNATNDGHKDDLPF
jgi:hypothetical protein